MIKLLRPFLRVGSAVVKRVLRSRFHWLLSGNIVLLELTGRRTGKTYLVPVNYSVIRDGISVMSYRKRQWWRNIKTGVEFPVYLQGRHILMMPEVISDDEEAIAAALITRGWMRRSAIRAQVQDSILVRLRPTE